MHVREHELISEKDIVSEMVEHDIVVKMPPIKSYKIRVYVRDIKRGELKIVGLGDFFSDKSYKQEV